jgi:chaperonin GroES
MICPTLSRGAAACLIVLSLAQVVCAFSPLLSPNTKSPLLQSSRSTSPASTSPSASSTALLSSPQTDSEYILDGQAIRGPLTLIGNQILVKVKESLTATSGGILLPDQAKQRPTEGSVILTGPGRYHPFTGVRIPNPIQQGVSVVYGQFDGRPLTYQGNECQMIKDDNVLLYYTGVTLKLETVVPVRDYVLIRLEDPASNKESSQVTSSGVVLAGQVFRDQVPCQGVVVKVGEGRMASGGKECTTPPVKVGDLVKFKDYAGNDVSIDGEDYSVVKMVDILCTLRPKNKTTSNGESSAV